MDHEFTMPADLAARIAQSRAQWAGWTMMADEAPSEPQGTPEAPASAPETPEADAQLGDAGKKALDAERKARRDAERQLAAANQQLQQITDQGKTELELATERAAKAEQQLAALQHNQLRLEVATAKGLPASAAMRLQGTTREELEADADDFSRLIQPADQQQPAGLRIDPPTGPVQTTSEESAARAFFGL